MSRLPPGMPAPRRGPGHYSPDGLRWHDDHSDLWYALTGELEKVEIEVEDAGEASMWSSVLRTLGSQYGSTLMRFVGHVRHSDPAVPGYTVHSAPFPRLRTLPDTMPVDEVSCPGMSETLEDLRVRLVSEGWQPAGCGAEQWSYRYSRPCEDWSRPVRELAG